MTDRESDLMSATVIPNEELLLAMMVYANKMEMREAYSLRVKIVQWARDILRINNAINEY